MQDLKKYFNFYIYSNIHVAIAAMCLTKITLLEFNIHENNSPFFVFFSTIVSYNFIRYKNLNNIRKVSANWIKSYKLELLILNMISAVCLIFMAYHLKIMALVVLIPFVLATMFYVNPFKKRKINLRDVTGLKLVLIAFSWAGVTVLFPVFQNELIITENVIIMLIERFLFVLAITIPFDLRDIDHDTPELFTLPHVIGVRKSKIVGIISLSMFLFLDFYRWYFLDFSILTVFIITIVSMFFVLFSSKNQNKYFSNFWVESIPILWFLLALVIDT